jgi:hypothetical protein
VSPRHVISIRIFLEDFALVEIPVDTHLTIGFHPLHEILFVHVLGLGLGSIPGATVLCDCLDYVHIQPLYSPYTLHGSLHISLLR